MGSFHVLVGVLWMVGMMAVVALVSMSPPDSRLRPNDDARLMGFVPTCREQLMTTGACHIKDFVTNDDALKAGLMEVLSIDRVLSVKDHTVFQQPSDPAFPADHARNKEVHASVGFVPRHKLPPNSVLEAWYTTPELLEFVQAVVADDRDGSHIYLSDDKSGSVYATVNADGDLTASHFDEHPFSAVVVLQAPEAGGEFEYMSPCCTAHPGANGTWREALETASEAVLDDCFACVDNMLSSDRPGLKTLQPVVGSFSLFKGSDTIHQVAPVRGGVRVSVVFAFSAQPHFANGDLVNQQNGWDPELPEPAERPAHVDL